MHSALKYVQTNKEYLSLRFIAKQVGMDTSNFYKAVKGTIPMPMDKQIKLINIVNKITQY